MHLEFSRIRYRFMIRLPTSYTGPQKVPNPVWNSAEVSTRSHRRQRTSAPYFSKSCWLLMPAGRWLISAQCSICHCLTTFHTGQEHIRYFAKPISLPYKILFFSWRARATGCPGRAWISGKIRQAPNTAINIYARHSARLPKGAHQYRETSKGLTPSEIKGPDV